MSIGYLAVLQVGLRRVGLQLSNGILLHLLLYCVLENGLSTIVISFWLVRSFCFVSPNQLLELIIGIEICEGIHESLYRKASSQQRERDGDHEGVWRKQPGVRNIQLEVIVCHDATSRPVFGL